MEDDLARASALLAKRRVPETRGFEKLVRFLMGKGFSYHIAADAVKAHVFCVPAVRRVLAALPGPFI